MQPGVAGGHVAVGSSGPKNAALLDYDHIYSSLFEHSRMCIAHLDRRLRLIEANGTFTVRFRIDAGAVPGVALCELLHPSVRSRIEQQFSVVTDGSRPRFAERVVAVDAVGSMFAGELVGIGVRHPGGAVDTVLVLVRPDEDDDSVSGLAGHNKTMFTPVQARILEGVAAGESTVQLASNIFLSRGGVEYHLAYLMRKLHAVNRPALVSKIFSHGVMSMGQWPPKVCPEYVNP